MRYFFIVSFYFFASTKNRSGQEIPIILIQRSNKLLLSDSTQKEVTLCLSQRRISYSVTEPLGKKVIELHCDPVIVESSY